MHYYIICMKKIYVLLIIVFLIFFYGCVNVFSPLFLDPSKGDLSSLSDVNFLNYMGDYYADIGDYDTARKFYQRVLEIDPKNSKALIGIANCDLFLIIPRTNIIGFYQSIYSNFSSSSNYLEFFNYYITNSIYFDVFKSISMNLYVVINGLSDDLSLTNDGNLHFNFAVFNKIYSIFAFLDSSYDGKIDTNDEVYNFVADMTNSNSNDVDIINRYIFYGGSIKKAMDLYFAKAIQSRVSLIFVTNKFVSRDSSIEVEIFKAFQDIDLQVTNIYTNFLRYYNFYTTMYNRMVYLLTNNGISFDIATNITRLTNAFGDNVSNYANFDNSDLTNILNLSDPSAWDTLTNYLDINRLTN